MSLNPENIDLGGGDYLSFCGIVSRDRTFLFASNIKLNYLLELTCNINFLATSIFAGNLEKINVLKLDFSGVEKCLFLERNDIIYVICGNIPDKKGNWVLVQMERYFSDLVRGKDVNNLSKFAIFALEKKFKAHLPFIFKEYVQLDVISDPEICSVEDWLRVDYVGLSSQSIGLISILFDDDEKLNMKVPGDFEDSGEELEMKEAILTAKMEAISFNITSHTGTYPRSIVVKLGFQKSRFITFRECENNYFLVCIIEGNSEKIDEVEDILEFLLEPVTGVLFAGNLRPFRKIEGIIRKFINKNSKNGVLNLNSPKMVELKHKIVKRAQTGQKLGSESLEERKKRKKGSFGSFFTSRKKNTDDDNNDDDYYPYPFIFKPPKPPDDFSMGAQVKVHTPLNRESSEGEGDCQYCGMNLTKEERFAHSCREKPQKRDEN